MEASLGLRKVGVGLLHLSSWLTFAQAKKLRPADLRVFAAGNKVSKVI